MAITTVDVVTAANSSSELLKNATTVTSCSATGQFNVINSTFEKSLTYSVLEDKYSNRFDDVGYYFTTNAIDGGGA